jgi:hypothetical protein
MEFRCWRLLAGVALASFVSPAAVGQTPTFSRVDYPLLGNSHIAVDLNGDGRLDLAGTGANSATVMMGNGDGTFLPRVDFPLGLQSQSLAAGDFNQDGRQDLAVTTYNQEVSVVILLGNGNGTFAPPVHIPNTSGADSPDVVAVDLNNDGRLDLAVLHSITSVTGTIQNADTFTVLLGNGDGTFQPGREVTVGIGMLHMAAGDYTRDGIIDLAITGSSGQAFLVRGLGNASYAVESLMLITEFPFGATGTGVAIADINGDLAQDVVFVVGLNGSRIAVLLNRGDGTFGAPSILTEPRLMIPQYIAIADFNGDTRPDIATALGDGSIGLFEIWRGNGDGAFQLPVYYLKPPDTSSLGGGVLVSSDFNGDQKPDIALQIRGASPGLVIARNTTGVSTTGTLSSVSVSPSTVTGGSSSTGTVRLSAPAPSGGALVSLTRSSSAASVPSSITVASGATSASFTVGTAQVSSTTTVTIAASLNGVSRSATLTINPLSPTTDSVSVTRAEYETSKRILRVEAASSSSTATLRAYVTSTGALIGTLRNEGGGRYRGEFSWPSNPVNITVRSSLGGSASRSVAVK